MNFSFSQTCFHLLLFGISANTSFSQKFMVPFRSDTLWGYADQHGNIIAQPRYTWVSSEGDNLRWFVYQGDKMGVVDENGNEILKPEFDSIGRDPKHSQYNDYYIVKDGKVGYAHMNGSVRVQPEYARVVCCDYPLHSPVVDGYNFLVTQGSDWTLIDSNGTVRLENISDFRNKYDGHYYLKVNSKWGFYSMENHQWYMPAEYDTIGRFQVKGDSVAIEGFGNYFFYGKKGKEIFLLDGDLGVTSFGERKLESFFKPGIEDGMLFEEEVYDFVDMDDEERVTKSILEMNIVEKEGVKQVELNEHQDQFSEMQILEKNGGIGLSLVYNGSERRLEPKYQQISILESNGFIIQHYLLVQQDDKWGMYGFLENEFVVNLEMDSITYTPYGGLFLLWKNGQVGIFSGDGWGVDKSFTIAPEFDAYYGMGSADSADFDYKHFVLYYFIRDKKLCIVGENSRHFFEE